MAGQDKYAFKDLRLVLKTAPVQASFKVESGTWPNHPVSMANGGKAKFHFPGFGPNFRVRISLSDASDLAQTPVFPAPGAELCRLVRIEEGVSFTGDFMVRAGSLARTSGADASAMGGLKDAVQQFLAARGRCGASNGGYITMASKSWTVKKAEP